MKILCDTLCYLENDRGEYLMLHRVKKEKDINRDKWIGVGGGCESGESPEECVCREVREETGLTLTDYRLRGLLCFLIDGELEYSFLYTATGWTGEMKSDCDEGILEWVAKDRVAQLPLWEGDKLFFRLLEEGRPFFSLKLTYVHDVLTEAQLDGVEMALNGVL